MVAFRRRIATLFAATAAVLVVSMAVALVLGRSGIALALGAAGGVLIGLERLAKVLMASGTTSWSEDPESPSKREKRFAGEGGGSRA